jgi:uncharacterized protein
MKSTKTESPCVKKCKLESGICVGCNRTIKEITDWRKLTLEEREKIIERLSRLID